MGYHLTRLLCFGLIIATQGEFDSDGGTCQAYNHTGVDYADANISVIGGATSGQDCCPACSDYNAKRKAGQPVCLFGVWYREQSLCCLKASGKFPVPRKLTASVMPPPPAPRFRFSSIFSSHMVLQASPQRALIWGFCDDGDKISVRLNDDVAVQAAVSTHVVSGSGTQTIWSLTLPATLASVTKSHKITAFSGDSKTTLTLSDVLFGDVWVCSGQSNMAYSINGSNGNDIVHPPVNNSAAEIADMQNYNSIRMLRVGRMLSDMPQMEIMPPSDGGSNATVVGWSAPCPLVDGKPRCRVDFSSMCYFFGRDIYSTLSSAAVAGGTLKRPIGLIGTYVGGTADELWSSPDALQQCIDPTKPAPAQSSELWNGMVAPLLNLTIKGAIWYQGEANSKRPGGAYDGYNCTFPAMIADWRQKWHAGTQGQTEQQFPFGFVQLDAIGDGWAYNSPKDTTHGDPYSTLWGYAGVRWAQSGGYGYAPNPAMPNVFMSVSVDTPDTGEKRPHDAGYNVHSPFKQPSAARLARAGLVTAYGLNSSVVDTVGPTATKAVLVVSGNQAASIEVSIRNVGNVGGVTIHNATGTPDNRASGFEVLVGDTWLNVPIVGHGAASVTLGVTPAQTAASKLRYLWYSNPCGYKAFNCAVYVATAPLPSPRVSGQMDFLPLAPFSMSLDHAHDLVVTVI